MANHLISAKELQQHANDADCVVIDASWHMPAAQRDAAAEWDAEHITGAGFFDLDACANQGCNLPHMLPSAEQFQTAMRGLGVSTQSLVVVYDTVGLFSAARLWWMLRVFGHPADKVKVLDGGLLAWKAAVLPIESGIVSGAQGDFVATLHADKVVGFEEMQAIVSEKRAQVLDARSPSRFAGAEPEPRPGVKAGHMDGAINVHYASLLQEDGLLLRDEALKARFNAVRADLSQPIVTSCGSGVTAAIIGLALSQLGVEDWRLYDGSWAEWGAKGEVVQAA